MPPYRIKIKDPHVRTYSEVTGKTTKGTSSEVSGDESWQNIAQMLGLACTELERSIRKYPTRSTWQVTFLIMVGDYPFCVEAPDQGFCAEGTGSRERVLRTLQAIQAVILDDRCTEKLNDL